MMRRSFCIVIFSLILLTFGAGSALADVGVKRRERSACMQVEVYVHTPNGPIIIETETVPLDVFNSVRADLRKLVEFIYGKGVEVNFFRVYCD